MNVCTARVYITSHVCTARVYIATHVCTARVYITTHVIEHVFVHTFPVYIEYNRNKRMYIVSIAIYSIGLTTVS